MTPELTGPEGRRVWERVILCEPSTLLGDAFRGGVRGVRRLLPFTTFSDSVLTSIGGPSSGGVGFSELLDGELSVHIRSLSDSSP